MQCPVCGQYNDGTPKFCPDCGAPQKTANQAFQPEQPAEGEKPTAQTPINPPEQIAYAEGNNAYTRPDYDPARDGRYNPPRTSQYYAMPPAATQNTAPSIQTGFNSTLTEVKPSNTIMIVLAIINIIAICCCNFISCILGIIALIFAIMANSATTISEAKSNLKVSKILNIIGLALLLLTIIAGIALIAYGASNVDYYDYSDIPYGFDFDTNYR